MSGIFGSLLGGFGGTGVEGALMASLPGILTQIVGGAQGAAGGGLPALLQQHEAAGLGAHAASWVGQGPNIPVTGEQLGTVFPPEQVASWAQQAGTSPEQLLAVLSQALPHAIDHATPGGEVPPAEAPLPEFAGLLGRLFGR
jgi:uncharacterized protein YidB (DUF937 family)